MKSQTQGWVDVIMNSGSRSFKEANPQLMAPNGGSGKQNDVQVNVERRRGKSQPYETNNLREIPNTEPQPDKTAALGTAIQGKTKGLQPITVRFIGYRVRPLDPDNFAGSVKDLLDGLRHAGIIPGDEPWRIKLETEQEKVSKYSDERTIIEIESSERQKEGQWKQIM